MGLPVKVYPSDTHGVAGQLNRQCPKASAPAYEAASRRHQNLASWTPHNASAQGAMSFNRELISSRVHDIVRNDGWASAGLDRLVDNVIGSGWRLSAMPNAISLGISPEAAEDLADAIEAEWQDYADDPTFSCDATRRMSVAGLLGLGFRHHVLDGEATAVLFWKPREGRYATCMQIIDPDRLSTPMSRMDTETLRAGVELDGDGAPVAYHFQTRHPGDFFMAGSVMNKWERVEREKNWGRPVVIHAFESGRAGQIRGISRFASILKRLKQIVGYDEAEMNAATLNAMLAAFIESPFDHEQIADALASETLTPYQDQRIDNYENRPMKIPGVSVNFLYPGEKAHLTTPGHPNAAFEAFERQALRNIATALGLSYEQLSMDWSNVNYSSARAALLEVWRGLSARKSSFASSFMQPFYMAWLEEAFDTGRVKLPTGAPPFAGKRAAYGHAEWIGPGRGWVDPMKEADAAITRIDGNLSTLKRECADQGLDWKQVLQQRARENRFAESIGLDLSAALRPTQTRDAAIVTANPGDQ